MMVTYLNCHSGQAGRDSARGGSASGWS